MFILSILTNWTHNVKLCLMSVRSAKPEAIVAAAVPVFSRYGYARTSMADIAAEAGVSRATLYLHFKDKEAVFRRGCEALHAEALEAARAGLATDGPLEERLCLGLSAYMMTLMAPVMHSPHGQELFDASKSVACAIFIANRGHLIGLVQEAIAARGRADAAAVAEILVCAAEGIKAASPDLASIERRILGLAPLLRLSAG
jgi:AcrR family transcriptional regulator